MWGPLLALQGSHTDAVDRARRKAKLAAGALGLDYRVHQLLGADDRIDGAGIAAEHAADTQGLVDDGGRLPVGRRLGKRQHFAPEKISEAPDRVIATGRAEIDRRTVIDDSGGVRPTTGKTALSALRLWQPFIDLLDEVGGVRR